ncbi:MAG: phosphotransferase [Anaerolineaceae bacterium]|nr:phosphotransferase [Anaerolineaceae bacterium]
MESKGLVVTAVSAKPIRPTKHDMPRMTRYQLILAGHSDPITLLGRHLGEVETAFYREISPRLSQLVPRCHFLHQAEPNGAGWAVLDDVPGDIAPERWSIADITAIIEKLAYLHANFIDQVDDLTNAGLLLRLDRTAYPWQKLTAEQAVYFDEGPAAVLSEHALAQAGQLAPLFLQAANGLVVMRNLGGWPGILGESHLTAVSDLLDDPVPLLEPLRQLPATLLHGDPSNRHWQVTVFNDHRLTDWQTASVGPGILDLVSFIEQFALLQDGEDGVLKTRPFWPIDEETMIDTYLLALSQRLGTRINTRALRQAIPAARCLYVLTSWFTHFATWFEEMPNKFTWQKVNRMAAQEFVDTPLQGFMALRPYLSGVFERFLLAYRSL